MISVFYVLTYLDVDKILTTAIVALLGIFMEVARQVFTQALFIIRSIPYIGPLIAKILVWPFFIAINRVAYIVSLMLMRAKGFKRVANARLYSLSPSGERARVRGKQTQYSIRIMRYEKKVLNFELWVFALSY